MSTSRPFDLVITGGRVIDPETDLHAVRNVGIEGDCIAEVSDKPLQGRKALKADGMVVAPGFIDLHAHGQQLPKSIFRVKGIVNLAEKPEYPCVLQSTGKGATLTVGQRWGERTPRTQIVFIGTQGGVDGQWLMEQLTAA